MPNETHPLGDGQAAWLDDLLGKGKGDPDMYGYPGEVVVIADTLDLSEVPF